MQNLIWEMIVSLRGRKGLMGWLGLVIVLVCTRIYSAESNLGDDCEFKGEEGLGQLAGMDCERCVCVCVCVCMCVCVCVCVCVCT